MTQASHLSFDNLIGQEKAKDLLLRSVKRNKLSHAYLFRGPAGVGKKTTALILAASLNCLNPIDDYACGLCKACRKFNAGNHPDMLHIKPDGTMIKINQIRELKQALSFPPLEAEHRFIVIEDVHTMRREAANSLLKTLEEPPADNILILTADEAGDLLPTIISRCQVIPFYSLPVDSVADILMREKGMSRKESLALAGISEGSLGRAFMLAEEEILSLRKDVVDLLVSLEKENPETVGIILEMADRTAQLKEGLIEFLSLLKVWLRDLMLLTSGGSEAMIVSSDVERSLSEAKGRWSSTELFNKLLLIEKAEKELLRNCNRTQVFEVLFFNMI